MERIRNVMLLSSKILSFSLCVFGDVLVPATVPTCGGENQAGAELIFWLVKSLLRGCLG